MTQGAFGTCLFYALHPYKRFFFPQGLDENMLVLYFTLKYFNSDRGMDALLAGNKNAETIYNLLPV